MRKLTIQLSATFAFLTFIAFVLQSFTPGSGKPLAQAVVNFTTTTSAGCTVTIQGNATYNTPPLVVSFAAGVVRLEGNCSPGRGAADLLYDVITDANGNIIDIKWNVPESNDVENFLGNPEIEEAFKAYLQQLLI